MIHVTPGDRIPLIPRHTAKAHLTYTPHRKVSVTFEALAVSEVLARGNENNGHQPDGVYYLGPGSSPGYGIVNLGFEVEPASHLKVFAQVDNALDHQYSTAAQLGPTGLRSNGTFIARPFTTPVIDGDRPVVHATFYAPGEPRTMWVGVRVQFANR